MKHSWPGLISVIAAASTFAVMPPANDLLPNYDRRGEKPARAPAVSHVAHNAATARLAGQVPNVTITRDEITGTPRVISRAGGFLTGPKAQGLSVPPRALRGLELDPHRAVKAFINEHSALFGQDASILNGARIKREFVTPHNGMRTVIWEQHVDGIPVFEGLLTGHITKNEELVKLSSHFIPNGSQAATAGSGKQAIERAKPRLSATEAIVKAAAELSVGITAAEIAGHYQTGDERPGVSHYTAPGLNGSAEASLVWLPLDGTKLRLCWQIILTSRARGEMFRVLIDADDATPILRHNLTSYISDATYRVFTSDSPSPFSPGHSVPSTNQPPTVARTLVTLPALNTNASPAGWINDGVNETRGNNVDAHLDRDFNDVPDLPRPQGSPHRVFDFPLNLSQAPSSYTNAAVTQLFYWNNWMHDKLYELGFTEAAGNFQVNNFGRGGLGNDAVAADAQDGAGFNNANMSTPPDGSPPRMQMFIFDGPTPDRDGDFDAEVVLHEYTHGLSNRRVGGGVGISTLQAAGMGEGWSDFYGLALLSEAADDIHGNYAAGGYLTLNFFGLLDNYYFGIRRYPYSTDMSKNPLTFKDIDPSQADPHSGVPVSPISAGVPANEVHNQGEVWCVALWDARANIIGKHGFTIGNQLMLQLVTDGMNLSPANPNFLEARDAIIQADLVLTGGANFHELWRAFAKRGMGFNATSPPSTTTFGIVESFDVPDDLLVTPSGPFLALGPVGGPFNPGSQMYVLTNVSTNNVIWVAQSSAPWLQLSSTTGSIAPGDPSATIAAVLNPAADLLPLGVYTDQITFSNQASGRIQSRSVTLAVGQPDHFTEQFEGDNDLAFSTYTFTPDGSASYYSVCREAASAFPVEPRDGKPVALSDDSFIMMQLAGGARITLYGRRTNTFFIGSNGYLTLDFGDSSLSELLSVHFSLPRVAGLMTDLNPAAGGTVTWQQMADRAVVSFVNVPLFGSPATTNSFQIEMFFDGRIRITYLAISYVGGIAGLSRGEGQPFAFRESDFSAYPSCSARFTVGFPQSVTEGQGLVEGTISIPGPALSNIVASLRSSNPAELAVPDTVKIGAGETNATFSATIVDDGRLDGSQSVAITAAKPGFTTDNAATTVHDNEQTHLAVVLPVSVVEGGATEGIVTVGQAVDASVTILLNVSNPSLHLPAAITVPSGTNSASFILSAPDNAQIDGSRTVTVSAYVQNWIGATGSVEVLDNERTELSVVVPATVSENAGTLANRGLVAIPGSLTTNLAVTLAASGPIAVPASVLIPAGQTSNRFDITILDDAVASGDRQASLSASASGWSADQALVTVVDDEYPPQPFLPSPAHLSSNNPVTVDLSWRTGDGEVLVNGGFETGDLPPWSRSLPLGAGWVINTSSFDPSSPDGPLPPFSGNFSVITVQNGPGIHELRQQVAVPGGAATLTWAHRIRNHAAIFADNQVFRVEIRDATGVLAVPFSTQPTDPPLQDWTEHSFDLTPFAGRVIDILFYERDELGFFNAHVDAVSILASSPQLTTYDVYFGTNANLGPANLLGSTTNLTWELPDLASLTTHHWQIVARRIGTTPGPIWQFTTRGVDSFAWDAIGSQMANVPFPAAIAALDELGRPVTNFSGAVSLSRISDGITNPLSPPTISGFINGRWSGTITIPDPFPQVTLLAQDAEDHFGLSQPISVSAGDDVSIAIESTPNPVMAQRPLALTLTAHNTGPSSANGVIVSNVLPASFVFVSAIASQGSCSNAAGTVVCHLGSLGGDQTATIAINVTPTGAGPATNHATIARGEADAALSNNSTRHVVTVLPFVTMALAPLSTNEAVGEFAIQLRLSRPTMAPISFEFRLEGVSATGAVDFVPTNGVVVIPPGVTNQILVLNLIDDAMHETNETFALVLTNMVNATPQLTRYTLTILDDDPAPALSIADASIVEGDAGTSEARFQVQLSSASGTAARVNYNTTAGLAGAGSDFVMTNGTIQIAPGATNGEIIVLVRGDLLDENTETFNVNLFGPTNATVADSLALGAIIDDDAPPSFRVLDASFAEGNASSTQFITVELSAPSGLSVIVEYATSNGTAIAGSDFIAAAGTLGFAAGTVSRTIPITILGDANNEGVERFSVALSNATGASIADGMATVTLLNDDAPPGTLDHFVWNAIPTPQHLDAPVPVTLMARDFFGNPATNFTGPASLGAESGGVSVPIAPAVSGAFVDGAWNGSVTVLQPATSVRLKAMTSPDHAGVSNPFDVRATNDLVLTVSAAPNPVTVSDTLTFQLILTNTGPGTALGLALSNALPAGAQFVSVNPGSGSCSNSGNLVICDLGSLAGSSSVTVAIEVSAQTTGSLTNEATIHTTESDAHLPNNTAIAVATVLPSPSISVANVIVTETDAGSTNARFVVSLSHVSSRDVSARFTTVPGSAGPLDFVAAAGVVVIGAGNTSAIVEVVILGDLLDELNETFLLELSDATNGVIATGIAFGQIQDQDPAPQLSIADASVSEGNPPDSPVTTFVVSLSRPSALPVSVRVGTQNSSAVAGLDYVATNAVLFIAPGATNATFDVSVLPDLLDENDETFFFNLSNPTNAILVDVRAAGVVVDDDSLPVITASELSVIEGDSGFTTGRVHLALSQPSGRTVSVQFSFQDGTAARGSDFSAANGTMVFSPGTANVSFPITINGDSIVEETEDFFVNFFNPSNAAMPTPFIRALIVNDDGLPGALDSFLWAAIGSPRRANTPFSATVFARDRFGDLASGFAGSANLRARLAQPELEIGSGNVAWHYPLASFFHDARCQVIYLANELMEPRQIAGLALNVDALPGQPLNNWTIRLKHTTRSNYVGVSTWESTGWTTVYRHAQVVAQTGWLSFPFSNVFNYNGSNHLMIDFSFDNTSFTFDGNCLATPTFQPRALTARSDSTSGDPIVWSSSPVPVPGNRVPNIRFQPVSTAFPITPSETSPFNAGIWTGNVTVQIPGTNVQLIAEDMSGRIAFSSLFDVRPANAPLILQITRSGAAVQLTWESIVGRSYRVDYAEVLDGESWESLGGTIVGAAATSMMSDALVPGVQRFYRVVELP